MGWRELRGWQREMRRSLEARHSTDPHSWAGQERDPWWEEQRRKHAQMRGR